MSGVVVVTGAASGNGRAIARRFLDSGYEVAAVDLSAEGLSERSQDDWGDEGDRVLCLAADVASEDAVGAAVNQVLERFGRIDVLVNNAGIAGCRHATSLHHTPVVEFDRVIAVNVRGVFLACHRVIPVMLRQGGGVIVNMASIAGMVAFPQRAAYTASKGAVIQLTRSIAADYGGMGIRCNALCPGMIDTPMTHWRLQDPDLSRPLLARIPSGEVGTVDDVAAAVVFLSGPDARYFNGAALAVDGGYTAI